MPTLELTLEELGRAKMTSLDVEVIYRVIPGEPKRMYERDGSGYPGYPDTVEFVAAFVRQWETDDEVRMRPRLYSTGRFRWYWNCLDAIALKLVQNFHDEYEQQALEQA